MSSYIVRGGRRLVGEVQISGSKNAALGVVAAAMAVDGPSSIENLPHVSDVEILIEICKELGAKVERPDEMTVKIDPTTVTTQEVTMDLVHELRGSYYLLGAFLGRYGRVELSLPGGCDFGPGSRPIDLHLKGFEALGAVHEALGNNLIRLTAPNGLSGASIYLDTVSVGATINIMLAAVHAVGQTVIDNAAREPHIVDVANFLNTMGANIRGAGTDVIRIQGLPVLPAGAEYTIIPDQIEAGTYMMMAPLTHGDITVRNVIPTHMTPLTAKLTEMGVDVEEGDDWIRVWLAPDKALLSASFKTMPYPGFPTDLQPQAVALLCTAEGTGRMIENVWENRYQYIDDLKGMGANIFTTGRLAVVQGGVPLRAGNVSARDLRAGAALVMAGLVASGETRVENVRSIDRGYENFVAKLRAIGADISEAGLVGEHPAR